MRELLQQLPLLTVEYDRHERLRWCSRAVEERNEFRLADVKGLHLRDLWQDNDACANQRRKAHTTGVVQHWISPGATLTGETMWLDVTARPTRNGLVIACLDVTDSIKLQAVRALHRALDQPGKTRIDPIDRDVLGFLQAGADHKQIAAAIGEHPERVIARIAKLAR